MRRQANMISKEDKKARKEPKDYFEEDEAIEVIDKLLYSDSRWRLFFLGAIMGGFRGVSHTITHAYSELEVMV